MPARIPYRGNRFLCFNCFQKMVSLDNCWINVSLTPRLRARITSHTFFNISGLVSWVILMTFTATFSDPHVPHHISPNPAQVRGIGSTTLTSPWSVYEAGNTPHDPHRDRKRYIVRWRNSGEWCNVFPINYKEPDLPQLKVVVTICVPHPKNRPPSPPRNP